MPAIKLSIAIQIKTVCALPDLYILLSLLLARCWLHTCTSAYVVVVVAWHWRCHWQCNKIAIDKLWPTKSNYTQRGAHTHTDTERDRHTDNERQ